MPLRDDLLNALPGDRPGGVDLRYDPVYDKIKEARREDDDAPQGEWATERKTADWPQVIKLASEALATKSKDLQLAMWLTEANLKLHGFAGLRDGLRLVRELMARFWDAGLYPVMEDGPEDRTGPFEWLDEKVTDSILAIPITRRSGEGQDYSLGDLRDARLVGSEKQCEDANGDVDPQKKRQFNAALATGRISLDMFKAAVRETKRASFEEVFAEFEETAEEFKELEKSVEDRFGDAAPNMSTLRAALKDLRQELTSILEEKRKEEPDRLANGLSGAMEPATGPNSGTTLRLPVPSADDRLSMPAGSESWLQAEGLIREGQVDAGLLAMRRLAANETTGRNKFHRKLVLAEVCLASNRERLARTIFEELAEQIEKHQLDAWEGSELISGVWTRLYELYKRQDSSHSEEASKLFERLCRLDPWQALSCSE